MLLLTYITMDIYGLVVVGSRKRMKLRPSFGLPYFYFTRDYQLTFYLSIEILQTIFPFFKLFSPIPIISRLECKNTTGSRDSRFLFMGKIR